MKKLGQNDELFRVKTLDEATALLRPYVLPWYERQENIELDHCLGRLLAKNVIAVAQIPHFRRSTVDGMAVRASDTFGATEAMPALLQTAGEVRMGQAPSDILPQGQGMLIPTGGMLPLGSDAVVMVEHIEDFGDGLRGVTKPVAPGENLIEPGEDVQVGQLLLERGHRIRAMEMGLLAAQGLLEVPVVERIRIGILSSGDEIVTPGMKPGAAQVRDINGYTLLGQVLATGNIARYYGIAPDQTAAMRESIRQVLTENDLVLMSGGSSVGARDLSAQLIAEQGELLFHGLALRPGKPAIGGIVDGKIVLGLPGHPASAMVVFDTLVRKLIDGTVLRQRQLPDPEGVLTENVYSGTGREEFVRVRLVRAEDGWRLEPVRGKSGLISTMAMADGLVHIPLDVEGLAAGQRVPVRLWRDI